jgi:NACHT domain
MVFGMGRGRWYAVTVLGLLVTAGVVAWRTWWSTSAGPFDPVAAVIALIGLAVSVASLRLADRAQHQADADVTGVARRLAVAVRNVETEARRQLLGENGRTINVQFTCRPAAAHNAKGASRTGTLEAIVGYYRRLQPRRMVITGAAGSGKTVLAVELILGLLSDRADDAPVPVRMSAALLDTSRPARTAVQDWLVRLLKQTYQLPEAAARQVVAAGMVLPVLDGLDEMDAFDEPGYASRAGQTIRACNAYLDGIHKAAMVLTCRIDQYQALKENNVWVQDAAQVQLRPVGLPTAQKFLHQRVADKARWQPVLTAMRRPHGGPLASALSTPWRLTLAATVYERQDPDTGSYLRDPIDLTDPGLDTDDKVRDHLLGLFIPAAVEAEGGRYPPANVHRWLAVLADYLNANTPSATRPARVITGRTLSGTDLVLHEMWPLAGLRTCRVITGGLMAIVWLGLILGFTDTVDISTPRTIAITAIAISVAILLSHYAFMAWHDPTVADLRQLRTRSGQRKLVIGLVLWSVVGLMGGFILSFVFATGLGSALIVGLIVGFLAGLMQEVQPRGYTPTEPREIVRSDLILGVASGLVVGLVGMLWLWLTTRLVAGLEIFLPVFFLGWLMVGTVGWRYITLILCTRRWSKSWLPWRLGSFLHWCYDAGLIRAAGIGYQFRHKELQDYLAQNPTS